MANPVAGVSHHIVLDDGTTSLGLLSADEMKTFLRVPMARTSLKTASGDTLYSDLEPPYSAEMQNDFAGGRGQKNLRDDKTRFYDSRAVDTRIKGQATLGPKVETATMANIGMPENNPGNVVDKAVPYGYIAQTTGGTAVPLHGGGWYQSFTVPTAWANQKITDLTLYLRTNSASTTLAHTVAIYASSAGQPTGAALVTSASATVPVSGSPANVTFTFAAPLAVTAGAVYWIKIAEQDDADWEVLGLYGYRTTTDVYSGGNAGMTDEGSWIAHTGWDFRFRVNFAQIKRSQGFTFAGAGTYDVTHLLLLLKKSGTVTPTVGIYTDSSGKPNTLVAGTAVTIDNADVSTGYGWVYVDIPTTTLTKATVYHIVVYDATQRAIGNYFTWGHDDDVGYSGGTACYKIGADAYVTDTSADAYFRINSGQGLTNDVFRLFQYKGQLYAVDAPLEGADASKLWMNGDRGAADSNVGALTTLIDATKAWTVNEWAGCVAKITGGPGLNEYRNVVSNTVTALTLDEAWTTTHTTVTEYVILGSTKWTDWTPVVGAGVTATLAAPVTDVLTVNGIIYFAQGDSVDMLRYREWNTGGVWTKEAADETTWKATQLVGHKSNIYRSTATNQLSWAPVIAYHATTDLVFAAAVSVGNSDFAITALQIYDGEVWIGKEDSIWTLKNGVAEKVPVDFTSMASLDNCRQMIPWNVYLFFPLGYGLERLFGQQIDDIGPNRDEGMPDGRQGVIADLIAMPSQLIAAMDAGNTGTSAILAYNDQGWHEYIRAPEPYERIRSMFVQAIPGKPSRLWFGQGNGVSHVLIPSRTVNPLKDATIKYEASGELTTSWIDISLAAVPKYFKTLKVVADGLSSTVTIRAYYRVDDATAAFVEIGTFTTSPFEEMAVGTAITGRRIQLQFVLTTTTNPLLTPVFLAYVLELVARIEPKSRWEPVIKLGDNLMQLNGVVDGTVRETRLAQLDTWAASATPLTMTTCDPAWTNVDVMVEPVIELDKRYEQTENGVGRIVAETGRLMIWET